MKIRSKCLYCNALNEIALWNIDEYEEPFKEYCENCGKNYAIHYNFKEDNGIYNINLVSCELKIIDSKTKKEILWEDFKNILDENKQYFDDEYYFDLSNFPCLFSWVAPLYHKDLFKIDEKNYPCETIDDFSENFRFISKGEINYFVFKNKEDEGALISKLFNPRITEYEIRYILFHIVKNTNIDFKKYKKEFLEYIFPKIFYGYDIFPNSEEIYYKLIGMIQNPETLIEDFYNILSMINSEKIKLDKTMQILGKYFGRAAILYLNKEIINKVLEIKIDKKSIKFNDKENYLNEFKRSFITTILDGLFFEDNFPLDFFKCQKVIYMLEELGHDSYWADTLNFKLFQSSLVKEDKK